MTSTDRYILLVEDNEDDVDLTLRALARQNIANHIEVARDGADALDFIFARGSYTRRDPLDLPQLVLLDINLPKMSGLEVLKRLRGEQVTRMVPVVMLTTSKQERDVVESYTSGANSYVQKPIDFREFSEAVRQLGIYWLMVNEAP
ncbi:MAG: response regulator [Trueperaceae bacterium]